MRLSSLRVFPMSRVVELFAELRDRRIVRILVAYLAGGWLVLQVVDQLVGQKILPDVAYRLVLLWYLAGIVACLILGWYHGEKGVQKSSPLEIALLSAWAVAVIFLTGLNISKYQAGNLAAAAVQGGLKLNRVGVLYFDDTSADNTLQYLADGLTEDLISELGQIRTLDVISRNGVAQFRGSDLEPDSIAALLDAGTLVDGTVEPVGDRVRVNLRLMEGGTGSVFQRTSFQLPADNPLALRDSVAHETARFLREWLGEEVRLRRLEAETQNPVAWALVQRAEKARKDAEALLLEDDLERMEEAFRRADTLLMQAETLDPTWAEPAVLRGTIAYRRSRVANDPHQAVEWIERGMEHADRALRLDRNNAEALELRGTLRYWHWLLPVTPDPAEHAELLRAARTDLEAAVQRDPTLASAHSTLSHLYYREDLPSAVLAARRAYEEDAYLDVANEVLWRLTMGSYDLEQFDQMKRWCDEGMRRFPEDARFAECQLWAMTTPAVQPDVDRAWRWLSDMERLSSPARKASAEVRGQILVGGVLARAGLADSARAVLDGARDKAGYSVDPKREFHTVEAYMRTLLGDNEEAIRLLKQYAAVNPDYSFEHHWWWRSLRADPEFRGLGASH